MSMIATVGHSTHTLDHFLSLLAGHGITAVADVRSSPYSSHNPQFNREELKAALKDAGIAYVFLGKELGARSDDPRHYDGNRVVYERLAQSTPFLSGIDRVVAGAKKHSVALMCAEKDPVTCHRTILVARELLKRGHDVQHIQANGEVETHSQAMERLMGMLGINPQDLFASPDELRDRAYHEQERRIAYVKSEQENPE